MGRILTNKEVNLSCNVSENITPLSHASVAGVSPINSQGSSVEESVKWYFMRAAYGQEKKAESVLLEDSDIEEVFIPQWVQERMFAGKKKKVLVSMIPNTLFVKSTENTLRRYIGKAPLTYFHHCYQPYKDEQGRLIGSGRKPIIIPDDQMTSFRKWLAADVDDKLYRPELFIFKENDIVRIKEGDFSGFTGHIVRLKGQTRVGINIEGVGFISTTYIPKNFIEKIK